MSCFELAFFLEAVWSKPPLSNPSLILFDARFSGAEDTLHCSYLSGLQDDQMDAQEASA